MSLLWDTIVGHSCGTPLRKSLVGHSCGTLLQDTLVCHSCGTLLSNLVEHSCGKLLSDTLWDSLVGNSCRTLSRDSCGADYRHRLLAMARPPENPTNASLGGSLFTPLIGVPMENSLDLAIVWALYGTYMCKTFWPRPTMSNACHAGSSGRSILAPCS